MSQQQYQYQYQCGNYILSVFSGSNQHLKVGNVLFNDHFSVWVGGGVKLGGLRHTVTTAVECSNCY